MIVDQCNQPTGAMAPPDCASERSVVFPSFTEVRTLEVGAVGRGADADLGKLDPFRLMRPGIPAALAVTLALQVALSVVSLSFLRS